MGEEAIVECTVKNSGNANLYGVEFCVEEVCEVIDLLINQRHNASITVQEDEPGTKKVIVSAQNELIEKRTALEYAVLDSPAINITINAPVEVTYGDAYTVGVVLRKNSYSTPQEVVVIAEGPGFESRWEITQLTTEETVTLHLGKERFSTKNRYVVTTLWKDKNGKLYSEKDEVLVRGNADKWNDRMTMILNRILDVFS